MAEALEREGGGWAEDRARELGGLCGSARVIRLGVEANEKRPELRTHDRFGNRIDEVVFDSSWHELMSIGIAHGLHALPWREPGPGAHVARAALFMQLAQAEGGVGCPISMTYSAIPALRSPAGAGRGVGGARCSRSPTTSASRRPRRRPAHSAEWR